MISKFSVKKPYTVLVGVVLAIVLGVVSFTKMTTDLLPSISLPYVIVMTTYPGASPETVEMVVTKPVEASMATVSNIENINSVSSENYSMVILEFAQTADMNTASLEIRENLDQIKSYWDDSVGNPIIMKLNPDMLPVMMAAVGVEGMEYAQISTYVKDTFLPAMESLEGVASASAVGLLEEKVNVIIRQEKVDEINKKVYASIDEKLQEARDEIEEGKQKLEDGRQELVDGKAELINGQQKLDDGKAELQNGKDELAKQQKETAEKLASAKKDLLTAKSSLEAAKMNLTTNLTTAKAMSQGLAQIDAAMNSSRDFVKTYQSLITSISSGDANSAQSRAEMETLKNSILGNEMLSQMIGSNQEVAQMIQLLKDMDWSDPANFTAVNTSLELMAGAITVQIAIQRQSIQDSINAITGGMDIASYETLVNKTIAELDSNLVKVDQGLVEIEKGQLTAAIEFANATTQINLGELQMAQAQAQIDTALEQLKTGEEQLTTAQDQLKEGEEKLEEGRIEAYNKADMTGIITVDMIKGLLTAQNFSMPAGYVTEEGNAYLVRVGDKPTTLEELQKLPLLDLHMDGVEPILLEDVADVFFIDNSKEIYTNVNGQPGCIISIQKQTGYSTGEVSDRLLDKFDSMMKNDSKLQIITLMDQGVFIDLVMDSVISNVLVGAVLAVLILLLFLKDLRPTLIVAFSIPISLVTAIVCMYFSGVTLNVISLSGLALGIGMLVDNSIVVIENIYRLRKEGYSVWEASVKGAGEVAGAIVASTLTTVCVFAPIVFTEGITRQLFVDMGLTIAYSLMASLLIALTVVPAMASKMLTKTKEQKDGFLFRGLIKVYSKVLAVSLKAKALVLLIALGLLGLSFVAAWSNGTAFMSDMDSTQLTVTVTLGKEATLEETGALTDQVVEMIRSIKDVKDVGAMASTSSLSLLSGAGGSSSNSTTIYVVCYEDKTTPNEEIADQIKEMTKDLNAEISVNTSTMDMSALGGSGISIQVRGRDMDTLKKIAGEVSDIVASVDGTQEVSNGFGEGGEEFRITVDKDKAVNYGLTVAQVFTQIMPKLAEASSNTALAAPNKDYSIYVSKDTDTALTRELLRDLEVKGTDSEGKEVKVKLSEIAEFTETQTLSSIRRAEQTRYVSVSASIKSGYNVGKVADKVNKKLEGYEIPEGYKLVFSGENETINEALGQVLLMLLLALIFMYLIMVAQFQSLLSPFIIMFTIPLAFTGGLFGLYVSGSEISVIALIGFVMLSGIIVNNGIVIIDYMNQLRAEGMTKKEAIMTAGQTRLRPVLMTALTTILGLSAMVVGSDMGSEMGRPMAITTIGGLLYGTLLTLIVIPCVYDIFIREKKKKKVEAPVVVNTEE